LRGRIETWRRQGITALRAPVEQVKTCADFSHTQAVISCALESGRVFGWGGENSCVPWAGGTSVAWSVETIGLRLTEAQELMPLEYASSCAKLMFCHTLRRAQHQKRTAFSVRHEILFHFWR
jgi:hypothetical protein